MSQLESQGITVQRLVDAASTLGLVLHCGSVGLDRHIRSREVVKPGLVLTGLRRAHGDAIHVLGRAEQEYLSVRPLPEQRQILMDYVRTGVPCVVSCWGLAPLPVLIELADEHGVPVFTTIKPTGQFIRELEAFLHTELTPTEEVHGVLVQVHDLGILITGKSGIGKSETALELVLRGHRMVADDLVRISRDGDGAIGRGVPVVGQFIEIRGLGILHAGDLFGQAAIVDSVRLDLMVELVGWDDAPVVDRTGLDEQTFDVLGVDVPHILLPVRPGRNIATIIEIAARNQILRKRGVNSARRYEQLLIDQLRKPESNSE
jgi:HPr kinase/phosphorylase